MKNNLFEIEGKVIAITGGYGVLGSSIAEYLAQEGVKVIIIGRSYDKGSKLSQKINKNGGDSIFFEADVLSRDSLEKCLEKILAYYGKLDVLINAAGGNMAGATIPPDKTIHDLDLQDFKQVVDLNLFGTVLPTLIFSQAMIEKGYGNIINISSESAFRPLTRVVGYSAAKAAVTNYTKYLAAEFAIKYGDTFRVNAIAPGFFITEQNHNLLVNSSGSYTERAKTIINHTPFRRFGKPEELSGAIHYLIADASKFVTGTVLIIDGGFDAFSL